MIIINGVECNTIEEVEAQITELSDYQKACIINDFYGIPNDIKPVTPRQMRIALISSGIAIETVEAMIDSLPEPNRSVAKVTWEYSIEFRRTNPLISALAPALGLSEEQVDDIFKLASTL
jgi:hypothetical protein